MPDGVFIKLTPDDRMEWLWGQIREREATLRDTIGYSPFQNERPEVAFVRCFDVLLRERDAARDAEAEARHDIEAVQAHCNLTQSELDDLAVMLGVQRDAPYGEVKAALAAVSAGDVNRLRDLADQIERASAPTPK